MARESIRWLFALHFLLAGLGMCEEPDGVVFKLVGSDNKFIGRRGSNKLGLTSYDNALRFNLEQLDNQAEKRLRVMNSNEALTEHSFFFFFNKGFSLKNETSGKQGFYLAYYGPGEYIFVRNDMCLSESGGELKRSSCENKSISKFKICKNRRCSDPYSELKKDVKFIKCTMKYLAGDIFDKMNVNNANSFMSGSGFDSNGFFHNWQSRDDYDDYGPSGGRRRHNRKWDEYSDDSSEGWHRGGLNSILRLRSSGSRRGRKGYDSDSSSDDNCTARLAGSIPCWKKRAYC